jgi:Holliday junction DNA helicase RuvA
MIAFLTGQVVRKGAAFALLDVNGVGYQLAMSTGSLSALPAEGDEVTVWTHLYVREDEMSLFGFESEEEKASFELLITVSGVGPKVALATLSALSPDALAQAVATEDVALISSVPGIGKKTAQRIILDLKDKLGGSLELGVSGARGQALPGAALAETTDALLAMGFSAAEASQAVKGFEGDAGDAQALLKYALRRLGGGS